MYLYMALTSRHACRGVFFMCKGMSSKYKRSTICYIWEILGVIRTMEINQQSLRNNVVPFYNRRPSVYLNQFNISCLQYSYNNVIHISNEVSYDNDKGNT